MFRLGDFYEMFFEDAVTASKILQITLTARNKGSDQKAPMCGVPHHAVSGYISKLTRAGKKVAICDQITEPNGKGIVERDVLRVITPGTTFDENVLEGKSNNYVAAITLSKEIFAIAYADITTGEFRATELNNFKDFENELNRISPAECIASKNILELQSIKTLFSQINQTAVFPYEYTKDAASSLKENFQINSLESFGIADKNLAIMASAILVEYLKETQKTDLKNIQRINYYSASHYMQLDHSLLRNLEIFHTAKEGQKDGSLMWVLDQTVTSLGGRLIRKWILNPLLKKDEILERLNCVETFVKDSSLLRNLRDRLTQVMDLERLLSRLCLGTGNARDLVALNSSLKAVPDLKKLITELLPKIGEKLHDLGDLTNLIDRAIVETPPATTRDGGMIKEGFNAELDEIKSISTEGKFFIRDLQEREIKRSGINSLKIKFNTVFGYYIEVSKTNSENVPQDYIRKQTLVNAERFITQELKEYEDKVLNAEDKLKELEYKLFYDVRMEVVKEIVKIQEVADSIAKLDVISSLAFLAVKNNYVKPEISDENVLQINAGRHPVIEKVGNGFNFVANDCEMSDKKTFLLITGPNMGGKSTYLRQVALIALLAQIGSYVPAGMAKIGIVDRIFTRVGASDNLIRGQSTFMVEMTEAAYILNHATSKSLIILDEIGRGTSTYDGVSIAWAITEFIHDKIGAKTLFATHYHELIELAERLDKARNLSVAVRENEKEGVVFLYKIVDGGVDKSYGIEVAKLAGLPVEVVSRARGVLDELETKHIQKGRVNPDQMGLFVENKREHGNVKNENESIVKELSSLDINAITPLEAIQKLGDIKRKIQNP